MNPEAQYRRYKPDYTGMDLREIPFATLPDYHGVPIVYKLDLITTPGSAKSPYSVHGDADDVVPFEREAAVQRTLTQQKIPNKFYVLPGCGHTPLSHMADFWPEAMEFLREYLTER